jgi:hypothetical protein
MRREIPIWLAVVVIGLVLAIIGLVYYWRQRQPTIPPEAQEAIKAGKVPPIRRVPKR